MLSSLSLNNHADTPVTYTLTGSTNRGAEYRNMASSLAEPQSVMFTISVGGPSSKANDKVVISAREIALNGDDGTTAVGTARLEVSIPRNAAWTGDKTQDLMATIASLLSSEDWRDELAVGAVPNTEPA
jgi:hypothetical protein